MAQRVAAKNLSRIMAVVLLATGVIMLSLERGGAMSGEKPKAGLLTVVFSGRIKALPVSPATGC